MDERRSQILDAARRLLRHYGPQKTTIADIAREADVGVGTVYLEFDSKEAIVEELSRVEHESVLEAMRAARRRARAPFADTFEAVMVARVAAFVRLAAQGQHTCELLHCKKTTAVKTASARYRDEEAAILRELIADARASGEIAASDADEASRLVQRAFVTLSPPWVFEVREDDALKTTRALVRLVVFGLAARR